MAGIVTIFSFFIIEISPVHLDDLHGPSPLILEFFLGLSHFQSNYFLNFYLFVLGFCLFTAHFILGLWPFYSSFNFFQSLFVLYFKLFLVLYFGPKPLLGPYSNWASQVFSHLKYFTILIQAFSRPGHGFWAI
jgi:hypothetical protein